MIKSWISYLRRFFKKDPNKSLSSGPEWVPMSSHEVKYNGGQRCDMKVGPCACGAWH